VWKNLKRGNVLGQPTANDAKATATADAAAAATATTAAEAPATAAAATTAGLLWTAAGQFAWFVLE
jgi:hypothetical protein